MADDWDEAINRKPVVQEAEDEEYVEIVWPDKDEVTVLHRDVAMDMFVEVMRIFSGIDPTELPADGTQR